MPNDPVRRIFELQVIMESEEPFIVTSDQRDTAAFELEDFGVPYAQIRERPDTFMRWIAWHALSRTGQTKLTWHKWTSQAIAVIDAPVTGPVQEADEDTPLAGGRKGRRVGT